MPEQCANIKADQALKLSNPAKILFGYMRATGITDAKQLATDLDIPLRTIQRLKLECASVVDVNAKCANDAISGAANDAKRAISGVSDAPTAPHMAPLARASKESPSEIVISSGCNINNNIITANALFELLSDAAGAALNPLSLNLQQVSQPLGWLNQGADLELDILPTVRNLAAKQRPHSITSWAYFAQAVANAKANRERPLPPAVAPRRKFDLVDADSSAAMNARAMAKIKAEMGLA